MVFPLPLRPPSPVTRTMRADHLNAVANDADVRPWLGGDGPIDLAATLTNPANLAFVTAHGGFVCVASGGGRFEVHSLFTPDGRGHAAIAAMQAALDYVFATTDATELVTKVPVANAPAAGLARLAGFREAFTARVPWSAGALVPVQFLSLPIDRWAARSAAALAHGAWLHAVMDEAKAAIGSVVGPHSDEEEIHLRMSGAALLLARAGNVAKGVAFYNRWASFAGYPPGRLLREQPDIVDLGEGFVVELRATEMEMLQCR